MIGVIIFLLSIVACAIVALIAEKELTFCFMITLVVATGCFMLSSAFAQYSPWKETERIEIKNIEIGEDSVTYITLDDETITEKIDDYTTLSFSYSFDISSYENVVLTKWEREKEPIKWLTLGIWNNHEVKYAISGS